MPPSSSRKPKKVQPAARGVVDAVDAATALMAKLGGRKAAPKFQTEVGSFLLRTVALSSGKRQIALRVAHPSRAKLLAVEAWALQFLDGAGLTPRIIAQSPGGERLKLPHHLTTYGPVWAEGPLDRSAAEELGNLVGRLHMEADVSLRMRAPRLGPSTLMAAFQALSDDAKAYLARREKDGLPQDLFTLSLSDMMRALRRYVAASEHHFLPAPARVLCHGSLELAAIRRNDDGQPMLTELHAVHAGDGAQDLAQLVERLGFLEVRVLDVLRGYRDARARADHRFIQRMCAWRVLFRLQRAVSSLRELQDLTDVLDEGLGGRPEALDAYVQRAREHMRLAINGLMDFTGPARPLSLAEVAGMGALIAVEELHLRGTKPVVGVEGPSYTGKTPLAQDLASRLRVPWLGLASVLRAAAWATGAPGAVGPRDLADMLARLEPVMNGLQLQLIWDGKDALREVRTDDTQQPLAASMVDEPVVRDALRTLIARVADKGAVVEGARVHDLLPPHAQSVLLWASPEVRLARREAHLATLPRELAEARAAQPMPDMDPEPPLGPVGQIVVDGSHLSLAQQVRTILRAMVPRAGGDEPTLSGRPVLFA